MISLRRQRCADSAVIVRRPGEARRRPLLPSARLSVGVLQASRCPEEMV
jgi:hypothetical protein